MKKASWSAMWLGLAVATLVTTMPAAAQSIAMITDVSGKVTGPAPVTILAEIAADARLQLDAGGRLVALYLKSGDEYTITGPGQVQFRLDGPQTAGGARVDRKASPLGKAGSVNIRPIGVTQAAFVMRSGRTTARIRLLTMSGTRSLTLSPEFRWEGGESDVRYRFELTDDTGRALYEAELQGQSLKLPGSVILKEGASYTWEVSMRTSDNRRFVSAGDFSIASAELRAQAQGLRPAAGASVSQRVAYAAWLEQMELKDEARLYWRALAAERPEDGRLKMQAAQ